MLILDPETDPVFNLAAEEYILRELDGPVIRLWRNRPCIVMGRHQIPCMELNLPLADELGVPFLRRISGGGTVYHDLGNLNFSLIAPLEKGLGMDFERQLGPILAALTRLGLGVEHVGRGEVRMGGRKISGNAAYLWQGRCLHHGTLLFDADLGRLHELLDSPGVGDWTARSVRSVRSPVTHIASEARGLFANIDAFTKALAAELCKGEQGRSFSPAERQRIGEIAACRYATREWNLGEAPTYTLQRELAGLGSLQLEVREGRLKNVSLAGRPLTALEGCWHDVESVRSALEGLPELAGTLEARSFF